MNFFKNGFLRFSLVIAGILVGTVLQADVGTVLQADDNYVSIKNNYRLPIELGGKEKSGSIHTTIKPGKTAVFEITPNGYISIFEPKPITSIVDEVDIKEHPNQNLKATISSTWRGKWDIQKDWTTAPLSVEDFTLWEETTPRGAPPLSADDFTLVEEV